MRCRKQCEEETLKIRIIIEKKVRVIFQLTGFLKSNIKLASVFLESTFLSRDPGHTRTSFSSLSITRNLYGFISSDSLSFVRLCKPLCQGLVPNLAGPPGCPHSLWASCRAEN